MDLEVVRNGSVLSIPNVAFHTVEQDGTEILSLDFYVQPQAKTVWTLIQKTGAETVSVVRMVWTSLAGLVTGRFGLNDVAGPVGTAQAITQAAAGLQSGFGDAVNNILY